jgi:hypothetical protein
MRIVEYSRYMNSPDGSAAKLSQTPLVLPRRFKIAFKDVVIDSGSAAILSQGRM